MAAYATLDDVRGLIGQFTIDATSKPTATQAQVIVDDTADEIDVRLAGAGFLVPVTAPAYFLDWLGLLNGYGAAAAILKSKLPDATGQGDTPAYAFWEARYQAGLDDISSGTVGIPDAATGTGLILPSTYFTRNPDVEEATGAIAEPMFTIGKVY